MSNVGAGNTHLAELPAYDCWRLLEGGEIARVAWLGPGGVVIVPVNYAIADGALWFRTSPYAVIAREGAGQWAAVEVDDLDATDRSGWSVVVRGVIELVEADRAPDRLVDLRVWPSGTRNVYVRVEPVELTGRRLLAPKDRSADQEG